MQAAPYTALSITDRYSPGRELALGCVRGDLPSVAEWPVVMRSRNNQLAAAAGLQIRDAVAEAVVRYGADRVAVIIGTSTSGIGESEAALREAAATGVLPDTFHYAQQQLASPAAFLAAFFGVGGPVYVHSSACASSSKAMAAAARLLRMGMVDAVITGGVDSLCAFTVAGFSALESVSEKRCNPLSANRNGINIGEGAALFLMTREEATVELRGWGETSDGYHISAPDPTGAGAKLAMRQALQRAQANPEELDYINLHGTATPQNDAMESRAVHEVFGARPWASSTKPITGHALGAAGAIEAALCWLAMQDDNATGFLPPHLWDGAVDADLPALRLAVPGTELGHPPRLVLSNSFAFGGANAVLLLGRRA
jgi:3-oxoacyl-[acyl-carrier-protein] synthase-1